MKINTNLSASAAINGLSGNNIKYLTSLEKLSTGLRINKASDDTAGLSISESLRTQKNGLNMADRNAQEGITALQVAEGSLHEVSSILQRLRELSVESSTSTLSNTDRAYLDAEFSQEKEELNRIISTIDYNSKPLLDGSWDLESIQVGPNNSSNDRIDTTILELNSTNIGIGLESITTTTSASNSLSAIDEAMGSVNSERSKIGSYINRLEYSINNIKSSSINITAAESLIRDVDIAKEMYEFTKSRLGMDIGTNILTSSYKVTDSVKVLFGINQEE